MKRKPDQLQAVILAAGRGRRLEPITLTHSKAMTPIIGKPMVQLLIEKLYAVGLRRFVVVRAPDDRDMESLLKSLNSKQDLEIKSCIQPEPKGTADALLCARDLIEKDFILSSCDNLYPHSHFQSLVHTYLNEHPSVIMTLCRIKPGDLNKAAGVKLNGKQVIEIKEKPGENSGSWDAISKFLFALDKRILEFLDNVPESKRGEKEAQEPIKWLIEKLKPKRVPIGIFVEHYLHLTTEQDLLKIHEHYLSEHKPFTIHPEAVLEKSVELKEPVMIEKGAVIGEGSLIGPMVYIGPNARIGRQSKLQRCIVYPCCALSDRACLSAEVIMNKQMKT